MTRLGFMLRRLMPVQALACLGLCVGSACQTRAQECQQFIGRVNQSLREMDARPQPKADDLAAIANHRKLLAERYRDLAKEVQALALTEPELVSRAKQYAGLAEQASAALSQGAKALNDQNPEAAEASQQQFDRVAEQEAVLVAEINRFCLGQP